MKYFVNLLATSSIFGTIYVFISELFLGVDLFVNSIVALAVLSISYFILLPIVDRALNRHAGGGVMIKGRERYIVFLVYALIALLIVFTNK